MNEAVEVKSTEAVEIETATDRERGQHEDSYPHPLRTYTGGKETVEVAGTDRWRSARTVGSAQYPELRKHLFTAEGKLRSFVNVYLNDDDIRYLPAKEETLRPRTDELTIIPSIAGGCTCSRCL